MKKYIVVLALAFISMAVFAKEPIIVSTDAKAKMFTISLEGYSNQVEVNIYDWEANNVFSDAYSTSNVKSKTFDASSLPTGKYVFVISDELREEATPFEISSSELNFKSQLTSLSYAPTVQQIEDKVYINALLNLDKSITIVVEDSNSTIRFNETYESDATFGKILDFQNFPSGKYYLRFFLNNKTYSRVVNL